MKSGRAAIFAATLIPVTRVLDAQTKLDTSIDRAVIAKQSALWRKQAR